MSLSSYIFPKILCETSSPYNKKILVVEVSGRPKLLVNGSRQSGRYIEHLWKKTFGSFDLGKKKNVKDILVLGVAGGTVIHLLARQFPGAKITGVDIDPEMIRIGKTFFGLQKIKELSLITRDAEQFVRKTKEKYDCIVVDLFIGRHIPDFISELSFLRAVKSRLGKNGFLLINYLRELEYEEHSVVLDRKLRDEFKVVNDYQIARNRFFYAAP